jgi:hypothetical protein
VVWDLLHFVGFGVGRISDIMRDGFDFEPWYNPKMDGTLCEYLTLHNGTFSFPLFKGFEHYKMLRDGGFLIPDNSVVRLMWNVVRDDEHFQVIEEYKLRGVSYLPAHAGREGVFDPEELLEGDCPAWEILHPNRERVWEGV